MARTLLDFAATFIRLRLQNWPTASPSLSEFVL